VKHQVSKDLVVAALITNELGEVLIVKPAHKEGWIFPGGYVEVGESPSSACHREILAEIGIDISGPNRLLSIDYRGSSEEYIMFIFDGGVFTGEMIRSIKLPPRLLEYRFVTLEVALKLLRPNSAQRLIPTLESRKKTGIAYLENQELF
jgi:8-oxo-dGTP diphosphatase